MAVGLEVADIFRRHGQRYRQTHDVKLGRVERRVMSAVEMCRTARLGGHVQQCQNCDTLRIAYNSCRNRLCPKCQGQASRDWLAARQADFLPVGYFHVVFTMPQEIGSLCDPVSRRCRDATQACCRSQTSRCCDRLHRGAALLGPESSLSPACPLHRARWRIVGRPVPMGRLPAKLLPARPGPVSPVPAAVSPAAEASP